MLNSDIIFVHIIILQLIFIHFPPFQLFTVVAETTDFLVDNLVDYFQGGLMDMAAWTNRKWHDAITMIENGTRQVGKKTPIYMVVVCVPVRSRPRLKNSVYTISTKYIPYRISVMYYCQLLYLIFNLWFSACKIPHNPLFINCSKKHDTTASHSPALSRPTTTPYTGDLTIKDFRIEKSDRGISIRPGQKLKVL